MPDLVLAVSHAAVAGTSLWCLTRVHGDGYYFVRSTYGIIAINSILGLWKTAMEDGKVDSAHETTNVMTRVLSSPGICASLYLYCKYDLPIALLHYLLPVGSLLQYASGEELDSRIVDAGNAVNALSMGYISFCDDNYMGIYAAICHALNSFALVREIENVPPDLLYNVGLVFYSLFALHAVHQTSAKHTCGCCMKII